MVRDVDIAPTILRAHGELPLPLIWTVCSLLPALNGAALDDAYAYAETGFVVHPGNSLRFPAICVCRIRTLEGITELDPQHGDEIVIAEEMKNLTLVAKHRMIRDARFKLIYAPTRMGCRFTCCSTPSPTRWRRTTSRLNTRQMSVGWKNGVVALDAPRTAGDGGAQYGLLVPRRRIARKLHQPVFVS